jgi:hypothetical protein
MKYIEYQINYKDGDVNHVKWYEAKKLIANPTPDIKSIERVTNYGDDDDGIEDREFETLYEAK